ncbi:hypothetical protein H5410_001534 [Solanum commersonii]|uniref:Uncharacterized protein n=1 Tax=Solanum commersonii TaxID=4109 RepID=A0A9J6AZG8_SOLCO|nr:hypothetical protein H5410_001534 [Solanum commersonii]
MVATARLKSGGLAYSLLDTSPRFGVYEGRTKMIIYGIGVAIFSAYGWILILRLELKSGSATLHYWILPRQFGVYEGGTKMIIYNVGCGDIFAAYGWILILSSDAVRVSGHSLLGIGYFVI